MTDKENLEALIRSETPCIAISTYEEGYALGLARDCVLDLNMPIWIWDAYSGISDGHLEDASPVQSTTNAAAALTYWKLRREPGLLVTLDLIGYLSDERTLRCLRDLLDGLPSQKATLVMVDYRTALPEVIAAYATPFTISCPDEAELASIVRDTLAEADREHPIEFSLKRTDFDALIKNLRGLSRRHVRRIVHDIVCEDWRLSVESIHRAIAEKRRALNADGLLEFIETPADLCAIGGLKRLKSWLAGRFAGMTTRGQQSGLPAPRGVLLLGVQGAGKSLCAKAIATAWQRPLLRLDPCALYDRYIGESERRLRDALRSGGGHGAHHSVDGRDREGLRLGRQPEHGRRAVAADVRHPPYLDAGTHRAGVPRRHRERHRGAAAGTPAQGPVRRDILRRPPRPGIPPGDLQHPLEEARQGPRRVRPRRARRGPPTVTAARRSSRRS